ncbi:MAG TPA: hypothetical protein DC047_00950 [Blastocatellia bacterium]|nr:hypothetical protein [Blastocatellia bacterium]
MALIRPETIRFIKLGAKGLWEKSCIEDDGTIRLGYESPYHENSLAGDWEPVRAFWLDYRRGNRGAAARDLIQIRDFYELPEGALWITFYKRKLYWCFAERQIIKREDGSRTRRTINGWSCEDLNQSPSTLTIENLDGRVTKVQGFRGTICGVDLPEYLVRKINGEEQPEVKATKDNLASLQHSIENLIQGLWWKDFELLVDLIFAQSGWQRISVLGQTDKDIDLDVFSPVTNRRAFIQVKSHASFEIFNNSVARFREMKQFDEMYFVVHTSDPRLASRPKDGVHILGLSRLSQLVINAGLVNWLITKRS